MGEEVKGSGRSIAGFHLRDALAEIDARHPGLLLRFGGHAMAAGLSLRRNDVGAFTAAFDAVFGDAEIGLEPPARRLQRGGEVSVIGIARREQRRRERRERECDDEGETGQSPTTAHDAMTHE